MTQNKREDFKFFYYRIQRQGGSTTIPVNRFIPHSWSLIRVSKTDEDKDYVLLKLEKVVEKE